MNDSVDDAVTRAEMKGLTKLWGARCTPTLYDPFLWLSERRGMAALRREAAGQASGRVLELGAGTGLNLPHYRDTVSELVLTEPEPGMAKRLVRRAKHAPVSARVLTASAEELPFADASFDAVVATLVFCTIADPVAALRETRRVLADGGRLLFVEHVRAPSGSRLERWQDRLHDPWRAFAYGCRCNQDTLALLDQSGFTVAEQREEQWRGMPAIVRPLICGHALAT
jgi:ubiquinone/menaquinone biosynthesis C-methylase UbiE